MAAALPVATKTLKGGGIALIERYSIAGYRISVDEELDRQHFIENQKSIITDFVKHRFPRQHVDSILRRPRSLRLHTFEQREGLP